MSQIDMPKEKEKWKLREREKKKEDIWYHKDKYKERNINRERALLQKEKKRSFFFF